MQGKRQSSRSFLSDGLQELTLEQKLYLARREVAQTKQERTRLQQRYEKIQDDYKVHTHTTGDTQVWNPPPQPSLCHRQASLKEVELRLEDIRRAKTVFERKLQAHMKEARLEKKEPEKLLQYVEDKSKVNL